MDFCNARELLKATHIYLILHWEIIPGSGVMKAMSLAWHKIQYLVVLGIRVFELGAELNLVFKDIDIALGNHSRLWGHEGPVTCLALDPDRIFSGSWDTSIRIGDRAQFMCSRILRHSDWVWALIPRGSTIASTAGRNICIWDIDSGKMTTGISNAHLGNVQSLALSYSGNFLFSGGEHGKIHMFDLNDRFSKGVVKPIFTGLSTWSRYYCLHLSFWLVSSSGNRRIALIDVGPFLGSIKKVECTGNNKVELSYRMSHGFGLNLFSVAIVGDRILCGDDKVIRIWNFSEALEIEKRFQALRMARLKNRMRRWKTPTMLVARADQCVVAAERNQLDGNKSRIGNIKTAQSRLHSSLQKSLALERILVTSTGSMKKN